MPTDIATTMPSLELGPGATVEVDAGAAGAIVTGLLVYGTYFGPGAAPTPALVPLFVPIPIDDQQ